MFKNCKELLQRCRKYCTYSKRYTKHSRVEERLYKLFIPLLQQMDAATKKRGRRNMTVHINGVETEGILDNKHESPAFIHGQIQDAKHIILRFAETSRREGKIYLQKM
jgi:hypothetical protein